MNCKYFGVDGICTKSKGDEVMEFCVEGPCGNEKFDEKKVREPQLDYRKMAILAAIKEFKLIAEIAKHKDQKIHGTTARLYEKFAEALERPRFSDLERDAIETIIFAAQQVTCPNANDCTGCGLEKKYCAHKNLNTTITSVCKILGINQMQRSEKRASLEKCGREWLEMQEYVANRWPDVTLGRDTGSSDTASLCDTGSSDTTFPVPEGH